MPIVMLQNSNIGQHGQHLAVLKENTVFGCGPDRFVKIKNSDQNEPEIEVKLDLSSNSNGWSLVATACIYIEFD